MTIEYLDTITTRDAIHSLMEQNHAGEGFRLDGDDFPNLNGLSLESGETPAFTIADVVEEKIRLEAEYEAQAYARNREAEFPSVQDLVVALYDTDDKSAIEAKRAAVKLKYPKPE